MSRLYSPHSCVWITRYLPLFTWSIVGCNLSHATVVPSAHLNATHKPAVKLSDYHFFLDAKRQLPNARVLPYDLNTPHFADYAHLQRFLWLPEGTNITYHADKCLDYPVGAVLILTIGYLHDLRNPSLGEKLLETRLLIHRRQGWQGVQYHWNEETTEAYLSVTGMNANVSWIHYNGAQRSHTYHAPNSNQCKQCHEFEGQSVPLGPTQADRINRLFHYADGTENQIVRWSKIGYLVDAPTNPEDAAKMPVWNDPSTGSIDERARAYLEMNCASCHRPRGLAYTSGLDLTFKQQSPIRYGVFKAPVAAGRGVGHGRFAIEPGRPDRSFLVHRLRSIDPGIRMPIVGRSLMHEEGVNLIEEWISQMDFKQMAKAQSQADQQGIFRAVSPKDFSKTQSQPTEGESNR